MMSAAPLPDGEFEVIVVDVSPIGEVDLAIVSGERKGEVLRLRHEVAAGADPADLFLDLLGMPGTLMVADGQPDLALEH